MKKQIHINQHVIKKNQKTGERNPVITVKTYKANEYGHEVVVNGPCRVIYRPDKPLSCGARVWIETDAEVKVINPPPHFSSAEGVADSRPPDETLLPRFKGQNDEVLRAEIKR